MKVSGNYASKIDIAKELAELDCRAVTLTAVARTKPADSRQIYKDVKGTQSQSGQTPTDHQWFFASKERRKQAAFLLMTYAKYREHYASMADAHGVAFTLAYRLYVKVTKDDAEISGERWQLLVGRGFERNWREISKGGSTGFEYDNAKVLLCRKCETPHLVEAHHLSYQCPTCS
jgi:hypothetical protein